MRQYECSRRPSDLIVTIHLVHRDMVHHVFVCARTARKFSIVDKRHLGESGKRNHVYSTEDEVDNQQRQELLELYTVVSARKEMQGHET